MWYIQSFTLQKLATFLVGGQIIPPPHLSEIKNQGNRGHPSCPDFGVIFYGLFFTKITNCVLKITE